MIDLLIPFLISIVLTIIFSLDYLYNDIGKADKGKWLAIDAYIFENHFEKSGLSKTDSDMFRAIMNETLKNIEDIESNLEKSISLSRDKLSEFSLLREYFLAIVMNPENLNNANLFNYRYVPSLLNLTRLYVEIEDTKYSNKEIDLVLKKANYAVSEILMRISKDYDNFRKSKIKELSSEVELSKTASEFDTELNEILKTFKLQ